MTFRNIHIQNQSIGSILLYSLANIANGFVTSVNQYAVLRFIAGIGLAGELGAGITLVSESLPTRLRGYGTTLVATVGLMGAVVANFVAKEFSDWQVAYFVGADWACCCSSCASVCLSQMFF